MSDSDASSSGSESYPPPASAVSFVPHDTLVIPPMLDEKDEAIKYGSGKSMAVHMLQALYGDQSFGKTMNDVRHMDDPPMRYVFIDAIPLFRSLNATKIVTGKDLVQVFMNVVEKESAQHGDELEHLFILNDNYGRKPMAKGAEDRKRSQSQAPVPRLYAEEKIRDLFAADTLPEDFEELCRSSRVWIMGMIRYCITRMLNATVPEEQVGLREGLSVYLAGHYLQEGDVARLDAALPSRLAEERLDIPLELVSGNRVRWREDLKMRVGEGDLMIPAMMRRVLEIEGPRARPTAMGIYSFDTDLLWIMTYVCHTWLKTDIPVLLRNMPSPAWVATWCMTPPNAKWINIRSLMSAIQKDPVFASLKVPVASMVVSAMCGGNDYIDGTPRVPINHYINAYRLAAPLIGDLVRLDKGGNGYWELDPGAFRRLVKYACWWSYQCQWKWDKKSPVGAINATEIGSKKIPKNLLARSRNVDYVLFMLNQSGNLDTREPDLAICGFERVDRTQPWTLGNIQYQKDDANPDTMERVSDAERFWQEQQSEEEREERMRIYGGYDLLDPESERARDSSSVDEAERLLDELSKPQADTPMGESSPGSPTIYDRGRRRVRGVDVSPVPLSFDEEDEDDFPGLSAPLPRKVTPRRDRNLSRFATPATERSRIPRYATPPTELVDTATPDQRQRNKNLPPTPATEEVGADTGSRKRMASPPDPNRLTLVADLVFVSKTDRTEQMKIEGDISLNDLELTVETVLAPLFGRATESSASWGPGRVFFTYDVFDMQTQQMVRDTTASVFYWDPTDPAFPLSAFLLRRQRRIVYELNKFSAVYLRRTRRRI